MTSGHQPTGETAIGIVPPADIRAFADHYRQRYIPDAVRRVQPHITVAYPFAPYGDLQQIEPELRATLQKCPPRAVVINGFGTFPENCILYLRIADPERVLSIYRAVVRAFPQWQAYRGEFGESFTPHLTAGRFSDPEELEKVYASLSNQRLHLAWDVEEVTVQYKGDDDVWHTWETLPLGGTVDETC